MIAGDSDILVVTPEKLDLLFRTNAEFLDRVGLFVLDEGQVVNDRNRGPKFEMLLSRLRRRVPSARFLFVSAVVPPRNARGLLPLAWRVPGIGPHCFRMETLHSAGCLVRMDPRDGPWNDSLRAQR